ncbi:MAG: rhomboid family intramembrane serine protease [Gemmatimonadota bacterium]
MSTEDQAPGQLAPAPTCYQHPRRETYIRCTRCDRYICGDCMREAPVGHQCVQCVREGSRTVRQPRTPLGGRVSATPVVTGVLIAVNVAMYLGELVNLNFMLSQFGGWGVGVWEGQWWRLVTANFLHEPLTGFGGLGILHIVFNMWWLWALGRVVEADLGRLRFLALYLLSGIGSSVLVYLIAPEQDSIGASGAVFGLAAAYFVITRRLGRDTGQANRLITLFLVWMVISAWFTSWQGHLGGLITGAALTAAYAYAPARRRGFLQAAATAGLLVLLLALVLVKTSQLSSA